MLRLIIATTSYLSTNKRGHWFSNFLVSRKIYTLIGDLDWSSGEDTCLSFFNEPQVAGVRFPDREFVFSCLFFRFPFVIFPPIISSTHVFSLS